MRAEVVVAKSELVKKYDLSSLRYLGCGGAPLGKEVADDFRGKFPNVEIGQVNELLYFFFNFFPFLLFFPFFLFSFFLYFYFLLFLLLVFFLSFFFFFSLFLSLFHSFFSVFFFFLDPNRIRV